MTSAGIKFELTRKRVKNINLRIHPPDGRVTVSAPPRTSEAQIAAFVAAKADWIRRHQARIAAQPPRPELRYVTGEEHRFLGTAHVLEVRTATGRVGAAAVEAATHEARPRLVVHARNPYDAAEVQRHLERLQRRAEALAVRDFQLVPEIARRVVVNLVEHVRPARAGVILHQPQARHRREVGLGPERVPVVVARRGRHRDRGGKRGAQ